MSDYKIIFTGPVGAGKTTAINAISDVKTISTDVKASDETRNMKQSTTVAMDYGVMKLSDNEQIHIYGTPGQERFDFMWDILTAGGIGLVLLINNSVKDPFADVRFFLNAFGQFITETKVVIGITKTDKQPLPSTSDYHREFGQLTKNIPIFEVDARNPDDIALLIEALLFSIDPGILT